MSPSGEQLLTVSPVPSVAEVVALAQPYYDKQGMTGSLESVRESTDATVRVLGHGEHFAAQGLGFTSGVDVLAVELTWSSWSPYRGRDVRRALTVIQVIRGGLLGGEGSEWVHQWVTPGEMSTIQLEAAVRLIAADMLPVHVRSYER